VSLITTSQLRWDVVKKLFFENNERKVYLKKFENFDQKIETRARIRASLSACR
jgi:hypothetical protein